MHTLTFVTGENGYYSILRESAGRFGFDLTVLGWGEEWPGSVVRLEKYRDVLLQFGEDEIVLIVDGYDVFFNAPASETQAIFSAMRMPFLFSAQRYFPSNKFMRRLADQVMGFNVGQAFWKKVDSMAYGRPCMGALIGRSAELAELFRKLAVLEQKYQTSHDQILINIYLQQHPEHAFVDSECRIFQSLWKTRGLIPLYGSFHLQDKQAEIRLLDSAGIENKRTGMHPQVIHAPFNLDINALLEAIGYDTGKINRVSKRVYIHYGITSFIKIFFTQRFRYFNQ